MKNKKDVFVPDFLIIPYPLLVDKRISPLDRVIYGVIYWFEHLKDGVCIASNDTISKIANCSSSSARDSISTLSKYGYLDIEYQGENKRVRLSIHGRVSLSDDKGVVKQRHGVSSNDEQNNNTINKNINNNKEINKENKKKYQNLIRKFKIKTT